jgi:DNA polymerase III subunit alpha
VPMIVTNDVHYVKAQDADPHDVLLCVQTSSLVTDEKRLRYGGTYFLKSLEQMRQTFLPLADLPESAFSNTVKIADMCAVDPEDGTYHLPDIDIPENFTYETYLRHLTDEGLRWRYHDRADDPDVLARTEHELKIIHDMGFDVYYLIVWDLCMYAKRRGIWWNVRGSGAGSIIAYAIGVTNLDPLRNKLIFERFLNPGRVTMPDFDLDFPDDQREELIRYTVDKYGSDRVAQIVTFGRMKARAAVRDVGRAMGVPLDEVDKIAKMIPGISGKPITINGVLTDGDEFYSSDLRQMYESDPKVRELLDTASQLEGVARHSSIHPAAVVVADRPLTHYTPLMRPPQSGITATVAQYEYPILESIGLLKVDFLGLATLTLMRECTRLIKARHGIEYTLENLPIDDPKIYELLTSGDVLGVFQVEGAGMRRCLMDLRPTEFDHITATISLYRPGPMDFIPDFIACLHGEQQPVYVHKVLEPILSETMGVCVYQEQVIQILADVAGYTPGEADLVRRGISKKSKKTLDEHREIFAKGSAAESGLKRAEADAIWDALMGFARYGFNRAHAADYAVIVAQTAFLKAYYPVEYMAALLTIERHDTEKIGMLIAECRRMGIEVLPPNINDSSNNFTVEQLPPDRTAPRQVTTFAFPVAAGAAIRMGLDAIKNVGEGPVEVVLQARGGTPFKSLADFTDRCDLRKVNRRGLECLVKVGALDDFGERGLLLAAVDNILHASTSTHEAAEIGQMTLFGAEEVANEDILGGVSTEARPTAKEILEWEKELVGVYVSSHPLQKMTVDLMNVITHNTVDVTEEMAGKAVCVAGMIAEVRTITTKKGDTMAFARLEDLTGSVDVTVFPKLFKEQKPLWATGKIVVIYGKADVRNGRVSVVADSAQDYVDDAKIIEDKGSVAYRFRNGTAEGPSRPQIAERPAAKYAPPAARYTGASAAGRAESEDEDGGYFGDDNPFAAEEPEWLNDEQGSRGEGERGRGGDTETQRHSASQRSPVDIAPESPRLPVAVSPESALPPAAPSPESQRLPVAVSPISAPPEPPRPRILRLTFRRSQSLDADRRRLAELVAVLSKYEGDDRFEIVVEANSHARYQLDFPNNHTRICRELQGELTQRLGQGGWQIAG